MYYHYYLVRVTYLMRFYSVVQGTARLKNAITVKSTNSKTVGMMVSIYYYPTVGGHILSLVSWRRIHEEPYACIQIVAELLPITSTRCEVRNRNCWTFTWDETHMCSLFKFLPLISIEKGNCLPKLGNWKLCLMYILLGTDTILIKFRKSTLYSAKYLPFDLIRMYKILWPDICLLLICRITNFQ